MRTIAAAAQGLRTVRNAQEMFLNLWKMEHYEKIHTVLEQVMDDIEKLPRGSVKPLDRQDRDRTVFSRMILDD